MVILIPMVSDSRSVAGFDAQTKCKDTGKLYHHVTIFIEIGLVD